MIIFGPFRILPVDYQYFNGSLKEMTDVRKEQSVHTCMTGQDFAFARPSFDFVHFWCRGCLFTGWYKALEHDHTVTSLCWHHSSNQTCTPVIKTPSRSPLQSSCIPGLVTKSMVKSQPVMCWGVFGSHTNWTLIGNANAVGVECLTWSGLRPQWTCSICYTLPSDVSPPAYMHMVATYISIQDGITEVRSFGILSELKNPRHSNKTTARDHNLSSFRGNNH